MLDRYLKRGIRETREFACHLLERPVADDVVDADPERMAMAKPAESPEHARVILGRLDLGSQFVEELPGGRMAARRIADDVQEIRIHCQGIREELGCGQQVQSGIEPTLPRGEHIRKLIPRRRLGEQAFQVIQRHIGVGRAGQQSAEVRQKVSPDHGRKHVRQGREVSRSSTQIAKTPTRERRQRNRGCAHAVILKSPGPSESTISSHRCGALRRNGPTVPV